MKNQIEQEAVDSLDFDRKTVSNVSVDIEVLANQIREHLLDYTPPDTLTFLVAPSFMTYSLVDILEQKSGEQLPELRAVAKENLKLHLKQRRW